MANITFSSIHVDNGQELGETPQVSIHAAGRNTLRAGDQLIVFFDLPSASEAVLREAAKALTSAYWNGPGGVTTALRLAIRVANDKLIELNRGVPDQQRAEGSISCLVSSADSIVVAQAGPALAYARSQSGAFEPINPQDAASIIGETRNVDVYFSNFTPQVGDVFVITGANSCISVNQRLIEQCMARGEARMVAGYLNANVKQGRLIGVAVSVDAASAFAVPRQEPLMTPVQTSVAAAATPANLAPVNLAPVQSTPAESFEPVQTTSTRRMTGAPTNATRETGKQAMAAVGAAMGENLGHAAKSIQRSLSSFGGALLPSEDSEALGRANENGKAITFVLAAIAVLLPIVVSVVVGTLYLQFSGEIDRQQLKRAATEAVSLAEQSREPAALKANWPAALAAIQAFEEKNPEDSSFDDARRKARVQLDELSKVKRIDAVVLSPLEAGQHRIAASAFGVYVMNNTAGTGQYFVVNPDRTSINGKGFAMNMAPTMADTRIEMQDVAWATTTGAKWRTEGAVIIGKTNLAEYSSATGQIAPLPMPPDGITAIVQSQAGEIYNNTVYVLDSGIGQIWRFRLSDINPSDGLVKTDPYFGNGYEPLKQSVDLAIDGAIYVLQRNGAVLKYFNRQPQPLAFSGMPDPIQQPVALAASGIDPSVGSLFIADAGSGSIFEFTKAGQFVQQFKGQADDFQDMHDMTLDIGTNTLYVATKDKLLAFKVGG